MRDACFSVSGPEVIHESIDGEVIVINLGTGNYYSIKGSGADVWEFIHGAGGVAGTELVREFEGRYDAPTGTIESSLATLLAQLEEEGLIARANGDDGPADSVQQASVSSTGSRPPFEQPVFEKYTDMQDLVLLDPVHEVDATGWPQPRPDASVAS